MALVAIEPADRQLRNRLRGGLFMTRILRLAAALLALAAGPVLGQAEGHPTRIGVIAGPLGSFAGLILPSLQIPFVKVSDKTPGDSLAAFDVLVIDNLFRLQDLNGPAVRAWVEAGGVLVILNPKADGFSRTWAPYDVFIGEAAREGKITERKHPLFEGLRDDKLKDFAESNGPFVGNCSFTEPAREWNVLAKHSNGKNALILEAASGRGWILLACVRFDHYNAKAAPTRMGENLFRYAVAKSEGLRDD
jgi:hypothetical protein